MTVMTETRRKPCIRCLRLYYLLLKAPSISVILPRFGQCYYAREYIRAGHTELNFVFNLIENVCKQLIEDGHSVYK